VGAERDDATPRTGGATRAGFREGPGRSASGASDGDRAAQGPDAFDEGFLIGLLVGEGHFGGDGRQPQVTLRMHTQHEALFAWLVRRFPASRLYGPYHHGGRSYYQWMARGAFLRDELLPILRRRLRPELSGRAWERYRAMCRDYDLPADDPTPGTERG
jgi:hypothetical protein